MWNILGTKTSYDYNKRGMMKFTKIRNNNQNFLTFTVLIKQIWKKNTYESLKHNKYLCKKLTRQTESGVAFVNYKQSKQKINMIQKEQKQEEGKKETSRKRQDIKNDKNHLPISW